MKVNDVYLISLSQICPKVIFCHIKKLRLKVRPSPISPLYKKTHALIFSTAAPVGSSQRIHWFITTHFGQPISSEWSRQ